MWLVSVSTNGWHLVWYQRWGRRISSPKGICMYEDTISRQRYCYKYGMDMVERIRLQFRFDDHNHRCSHVDTLCIYISCGITLMCRHTISSHFHVLFYVPCVCVFLGPCAGWTPQLWQISSLTYQPTLYCLLFTTGYSAVTTTTITTASHSAAASPLQWWRLIERLRWRSMEAILQQAGVKLCIWSWLAGTIDS